ncbi:MAG: Zn-dependent protease [Bacteroidetes bacterium]|nr:MAG: Zn-dependent protease [Bacteroidota bacterium]
MRSYKLYAALTAIALLGLSCSKVPITNRRQTNLFSESEMMNLGRQNYTKFLQTNMVVPVSDPQTVLVKKVGNNISKAITDHLKTIGKQKRIAGYVWEFNLIKDDKTVNAWCMPGGKVAVYTGLLPVTKDEDGLAVVMGHEVAHAIARHGNERMSQATMVKAGGAVVSAVAGASASTAGYQKAFENVYGVGSAIGQLAYSRKHETEADKLGLVFMALAGYDPSKAVDFWQRMAANGGGNVPQIMSTHPSDEKRIKDIKEFLPTAMKYYKKPVPGK